MRKLILLSVLGIAALAPSARASATASTSDPAQVTSTDARSADISSADDGASGERQWAFGCRGGRAFVILTRPGGGFMGGYTNQDICVGVDDYIMLAYQE